MSEQANTVDVSRLAELVRSEPDEERDCLLCHETMAAPDAADGEEATPLCRGCSLAALGRLAAEVERLRAQLAPSPAGTVRLLYPDGTWRDVGCKESVPFESHAGGTVARRVCKPHHWEAWRGGWGLEIASDWNLEDGADCFDWVEVRVETHAEEAARERAARLEAERQRDEARAEVVRLKADLRSFGGRGYALGFEGRPWED